MRGRAHHAPSPSGTVNHRAQLANAYQELGKELASQKIRVVGNYTLGKVIGEGTYGKVRMGTHRLTSTRVAIKQIPKEFSAQLTWEIHHHRRLHHPHVTQLYEVIATESSTVLDNVDFTALEWMDCIRLPEIPSHSHFLLVEQ